MSQRKGRERRKNSMPRMHRAEQHLDEIIISLEMLVGSKEPLRKQRLLDGMFGKLRTIRRSMGRLDKRDPQNRIKFWNLSRRAVRVGDKITKMLSST
jgi:hypothetical protein